MGASVGLVAGLLACGLSVLSNSSAGSSSYSCSKVSPKRSTPLQIHVSRLLIKHGSMRPEVAQRGNRCRKRHVVMAAMNEVPPQRPH